MTGSRDGVLCRAEAHIDDGTFQADLARRIAIPTESQEPGQRAELDRYLQAEIAPSLGRLGFTVRLLDNPDPTGGPFLLAERIEDEARATLLTYGHGDVVRGLPEQWRSNLDPWRLTVDGDRWYGRGTADNKGQHSLVMAALAIVLAERGQLGFNAKILIETGEEIGSPGLDVLCGAEKQALAADLFLASDGPRLTPAIANLSLGNRGAIAFDLSVELREGSHHSGHFGGLIEDPGIILAHALATITDGRGRILVPDWLPKKIPSKVRQALGALEIDPADRALIMPEDWGEPGLNPVEKTLGWTSFIILAFLTGRPENPMNGVQPNARARCQIRFTADIEVDELLPALRLHLDERGLHQVEITQAGHNVFPAWRTDPDDPWVEWALASMTRTLGRAPRLVPNSSGGLPSEIFARHLQLPVLWVPHSYGGCCQHGPDEHLLLPLTREGLALMTGLFWDLGDAAARPLYRSRQHP